MTMKDLAKSILTPLRAVAGRAVQPTIDERVERVNAELGQSLSESSVRLAMLEQLGLVPAAAG